MLTVVEGVVDEVKLAAVLKVGRKGFTDRTDQMYAICSEDSM